MKGSFMELRRQSDKHHFMGSIAGIRLAYRWSDWSGVGTLQ